MYELWLLSISYRIIKAVVQLISRHWVLIVFAFFLGILAGIAAGSFFIASYALLRHRQEPTVFNTKIYISLILCIIGCYCLTTDFYKDFPNMYKATAIGNALGLLLTTAYIVRFAVSHQYNNNSLLQPLLMGLAITVAALLTYNHYFDVSDYLLAPGKQFHILLQDEKRAKYRSEFEVFENSHYKLEASDRKHFTMQEWERADRLSGSSDDDYKGTLLIVRFTALFQVTYYTNSRRDGPDVKTYKAFINGTTADYTNGNIIFPHGEATDMDFDKVDYEQEMHIHILTEIAVEAEVMPDDLDSYIQYREKGYFVGQKKTYMISKAYLKSKGIPVTIAKF